MSAYPLNRQITYNYNIQAYSPMFNVVKTQKQSSQDKNIHSFKSCNNNAYYNPSVILLKPKEKRNERFTYTPIAQPASQYQFKYNPMQGCTFSSAVNGFTTSQECKRIVKVIMNIGSFIKSKIGSILTQCYHGI